MALPLSPSFYDVVQATAPVRPPEPQAPRRPTLPGSPTLSLEYPNRCTLSKALMAQVPELKAGGRVLLAAPIMRGGQWFLQANPPAKIGSKIPARGRSQFRVHPIARTHFFQQQFAKTAESTPAGGPVFVANQNVQRPRLEFRLGAPVVGCPGYYELLRIG